MSVSSPRVSIGMPVYNGESYIGEAIDSILAQTYTDFELIISDNGSSDATQQICTMYAAMDDRIRYVRNESNRGASWNFRRVFDLARGEYFKWMAHDDVCDNRFLELCVKSLDGMPDVILCSCKTKMIDENGEMLPNHDVTLMTNSSDPSRRFLDLLRIHHYYFQIQGLIRRSALEKTQLIGSFVSSDIVLLAELSLAGRFNEIPEYLFYCRIHSEQSVQMSRYLRAAWFDPARAGRIALPQWRLFAELFRCLGRAQLDTSDRIRCCLYVLCWPAWNMNFVRMGKDLLVALVLILVRTRQLMCGWRVAPS
jgi:glycosyltransferase involved in cell wall biosynthesis